LKRRDHRRLAEELAKVLGLEDCVSYAEAGADAPDFDLYFGTHRKTLHNLYPMLLAGVISDEKKRTAYLLGVASHVITDKFSKHISAGQELLSLIRRLVDV